MSGGKQRGRVARASGKSRNSDRADAPLGKCYDDLTAQNWPCFDREQSVAEPTEIAASQRELGLGESAGV